MPIVEKKWPRQLALGQLPARKGRCEKSEKGKEQLTTESAENAEKEIHHGVTRKPKDSLNTKNTKATKRRILNRRRLPAGS